jgi:ubiquinone/menaquinone biosynthesis C-methylase UbiE
MKNKNKLRIEEKFHDNWANSMDLNKVMVDESFEACTSPENKIIMKNLGNLKNKKILELGCGAGEVAVYFAKKGAIVTATDLSGGMLHVVQKLASKHGVKVKIAKCGSEHIPFPGESFDIVYAANLLHHVEQESTVKEVRRVLKKGGLFVSWDPLDHNPLINIYRRIATKVRTDDERPLKMKDVKKIKKFFSESEYFTTWFFTLWLFLKFYLIDKVDPNKERYWKKIITDHKRLEKTYKRLERIDSIFLKIFPFMKRYCWNVVIIAKK